MLENIFYPTTPCLCFQSLKYTFSFRFSDKNLYLCPVNLIKQNYIMSIFRVILSVIFPPLAVFDKGCGSILIVLLLTLCGWIPGVIGALVILNKS